MSYEILDINTVARYAKEIKAISDVLGEGEYKAKEVGDGNLNLVFIVDNPDKQTSVVIKQALPYLRCVGESFKLGEQRMLFEIRSMLFYEKIAPTLVPQIYHYDEAKYTLVMQNLSNHIIMRKGILDCIEYPKFAEDITDFIAKTAYATSVYGMDSHNRSKLYSDFAQNGELRKLTEDFVFSFPYMQNETNRHNSLIDKEAEAIKNDGAFKQKAMELKYIFMTKAEALLHGDLHTGSVMLNPDETYVIDSEFAFMGPIGFDLGAVVANLLMASIAMNVREKPEYAEKMERAAYEVIEKFGQKFEALLSSGTGGMYVDGYWNEGDTKYKEALAKKITADVIKESVGFAGCKMARRQLGVAHILEIESIEDETKRAIAETKALETARKMVLNYEGIDSAEKLKNLITEAK